MITPADSAASPADFDAVSPHRRGPAWYDIQASQDDLTGTFDAANSLAGAGVLYPQGPRQRETETLITSPQGFAVAGYDIDSGFSGGGGDGWPADVEPGG